ncbi:amino acid ABC transporter permease [Brevibacillus humidisoli]|uniref:amino acid ABC transporter permease n=1 Tax=Brevibacillus humidisoli TaxID=2895522 RepID=UPI001E58903E|nr:amino acid ABC transporter permease [Brevibacillus humidisoli]UFJ42340.1 amino acid ABC transporter permease [Brevibacillus humidisoli]
MNAFVEIFVTSIAGFAEATWMTLRITVASLLLASLIGLMFAFMKLSPRRTVRLLADGYIGLIRGTPLIVQIMWLYFGITHFLVLSKFWAGVLALAIHSGAYIAEIFRGAIQSIDRGQMEAAQSLGMSYPLAMRRIILPQAFKRAIPPLGNQFIIGLKDSSLVAFIGVSEIFQLSMSGAAATFKQLEYYTIAGLYYLLLVVLFTLLLRRIERHLDTGSR